VSSFASQIQSAPVPADQVAVERGLERWRANGDSSEVEADDPLAHPELRSLLEGVFAGSPYLTNLAMREGDLVRSLMIDDAEVLLERELDTLRRHFPPDMANSAVSASLRKAKRRIALLLGLADLGAVRDLHWVTSNLARFAGIALDAAFGYLLAQSAAKGELTLSDPAQPVLNCGVTILAMGKMGAFELNYSSDIDLIVIYDEERIQYSGKRDLSDHLSRMIRALIQLMQERTGEGYVFRTDLRLRPDPSVSPLAISADAAMIYYETLAQNWERAAMIKARAASGDTALGEEFLEYLGPFIWRRSLDYAAIADIQSIKRQIHASKGHGQIAVAGHDIKVGRGGIREIEFFAQTQQLIAGGRDPRLRVPGTLAAIDTLVETGRVEDAVRDDLRNAYIFLRQTEHRLQMLDDAQTQKLPESQVGLDRLSAFCGYESFDGFASDLTGHMSRVAEHYAELFAEAPTLAADHGNLVFTGTDDDPGTVKTLKDFGFNSPSGVISAVKSWHAGRHRAMRTTRARQMLTVLIPSILQALSETSSPDNALANFDRFLGRLPTGIQFMSLLHANPELLHLLARIMGTAPALAELLARNAALLDVLLEPSEALAHDHDDLIAHCDRELSKAEDYEGVLDAVRRFANDRRFEIGVGLLTRQLDFDQTGNGLSDVAETVIKSLLPHVESEVARRHGRVPGAGMAVVAMGKLGGRELTFGSDLDLVFVYDDSTDALSSDGTSPLQIGPFFTRLSQRFISAVTALTSEGMLYEVDMRLRPSGNKGAVAVPLSAYAAYMENEAWTWEIMAATRARVLGGPADLCARVNTVLNGIIAQERDTSDLRSAVLDMRGKIHKQHGTQDRWTLKHVRGGLVDLEFLIQYLTLNHAHDTPHIICGHVSEALKGLYKTGLLGTDQFETLSNAYRHLKGAQTLLRLCYSYRFSPEEAAPDFRRLIAESLGCADFEAVSLAIGNAQNDVLAVFEEIVGKTG
jgi:glutamate-ammonia-ligase adenylyltransferase